MGEDESAREVERLREEWLETSHITWNPRLPDSALMACVGLVGGSMTYLDLYGSGHLTDASLLATAVCCPNFATVDLSWRGRLTDMAVQALALLPLKDLRCHGCPRLGDAGFGALADCRVAIRILDASGTKLTAAGLTNLVDRCGLTLVELNAVDCHVDAATVAAVAEKAPHLRKLAVNGVHVTDAAAFDQALRALPATLKTLEIRQGTLATTTAQLAKNLPNVGAWQFRRRTHPNGLAAHVLARRD